MQPLACCCCDQKCLKSPLAPAELGTQYGNVAVTYIWVLFRIGAAIYFRYSSKHLMTNYAKFGYGQGSHNIFRFVDSTMFLVLMKKLATSVRSLTFAGISRRMINHAEGRS